VEELRRAYHDRIGWLRDVTIDIVRDAADAVENVTSAILDHDRAAGEVIAADAVEATTGLPGVETEVLDLLAQQAPVARDLRIILASLRIAQVGELCLGLCRSLASRVGLSDDVLTPALRVLIGEMGSQTAALLEQANGAWIALDQDQARAVISSAERCRELQRRFLAELLSLEGVPVDAAVGLGMAARAYERLTDHAVDIAGRVVFAATGAPPAVGDAAG